MTVWVLTREENDYDQYGEYFVAAFHGEKPDVAALAYEGVPRERCAHVKRGGGRVDTEDTWYWLREHVATGANGRLQRVAS